MLPLLEPIPPGEPGADLTVEEIGGFGDAMAWFEAEEPTVRTLIEQSGSLPAGPLAWQLATTMTTYYQRSGRVMEWLAVMNAALASAGRAGDPAGEAHVRRCLAGALYHLGDGPGAREQLRRAGAAFASLGLLVEEAHVHTNLGHTLAFNLSSDACGASGAGDYRAAEAEFVSARRLYVRAGYPKGIARADVGIATCLVALGDHDRAIELFDSAATIFTGLADHNGVADCEYGLGALWRRAGDPERAAGFLRRSIALYREAGNRTDEAAALVALGDTLVAADEAAGNRAWRAALSVLEELRLPAAVGVRNRLRPGRR